jgi:hypothetical protein
MDMKSELFISKELETKDGYTWTMASRLGDMLRKAEELFGKRDMEYTILGVEFALTERPQVWYPGNYKHIIVQLNKHALENLNQALYQLSHETVHCLSPIGKKAANILEEGLATYFSEWYMKQNGLGDWFASLPEYIEAVKLVKDLLAIDSDIIKKVRAIQTTISEIKPEELLQANNNIPKELADKLCEPFYPTTDIVNS